MPADEVAAAMYRACGHAHRDAGARVRRQLLALDAARYGHRELARELAEVTVVVQGRGLAVADCEDGTLHWWDPATGRKPGEAVADARALRVLTAVVDRRPVAVTAGRAAGGSFRLRLGSPDPSLIDLHMPAKRAYYAGNTLGVLCP